MRLIYDCILVLLWLGVVCSALGLAVACLTGCDRPQVKTPYRCSVKEMSLWLVQNVERVNGPSLTGMAWARHQMAVRKSRVVSHDGFGHVDEYAKGLWDVKIEHVGTQRVKVGLVQIREAETWAEFRNYQEQVAVIGIGLEVRF